MPADEQDRAGTGEDGPASTAPDPSDPTEDVSKPKRRIKAPSRRGVEIRPDLEGKQTLQGSHVGDRYVRVIRQGREEELKRIGPDYLVAGEDANASRSGVGRTLGRIKRVLIGQPLTTASAIHERLTKVKALAVLSSDALSSVAYATEEILRILVLAGIGAMSLSLPIGGAIIALLFIVGFSYRQTIKAYPHGGGSYIVAKDNLGEIPALVAGGSLLVAYILTVSVSISAAVAALVSAVPEMQDHLVAGGLGFIVLVTILNLRGIRESGSIFAAPTYLFLAGIAVMLVVGFIRNAANGFEVAEPNPGVVAGTGTVSILLILRAFASGCAALTGVEAISDGVPAFKPPEWKNARTTLTVMIGLLAVMFAGITFLAHQYGAAPLSPHGGEYETVVSQIARGVFGGTNAAYYFIQFATVAILVLAANTAYSDFPRLAYFMARDKYMPSQFTFRGDRLAYTTGIVTLGVLSAIVLAVFGGQTERLIPLYAVGVFVAFTLSQLGMVVRWQTRKEPGWKEGRVVNAVGATTTAIVAGVVGFTRFLDGAWIVIILIPLLILLFRGIHRHYIQAADELMSLTPMRSEDITNIVVVPIAAINRVARQTLAYARSISDSVSAIHISDDEDEIDETRKAWTDLATDVPLVIIESPYRSLVGPLLRYLDELQKQAPAATLTVVLPEYVPRHWWEQILHNQSALRIKAALLFRPGTVVISVPYHLDRNAPVPSSAGFFQRRL
ncbi:MAG: APC family permease [Chloroflexota bacterium]|nr:APC family permease [Chloroflexota bacterium]